MSIFIAALALTLGLGACALAFWRARAGRGLSSRQRRRRSVDLRRQLISLKADRADGKIDDTAYQVRRDELGRQYIALSHAEPRVEQQARDTWWPWLGALGLAGMALGVALLIWPMQPTESSDGAVQSKSTDASAVHPLRAEQVEGAVAQMRARVKQNPKDAAAWAMLAHSFDMLGNHAEGSAAYSKLIELVPDDPQVLVDAADSMALARGRRFDGEPLKLIQRALALDPKNLKALSLAGTDAFDHKDFAQATSYWQRARALVTDPALARELDDRISQARVLPSRPASAVAASPTAAAASNASGFVAGKVIVSDKIKSRVAPDDVLFIFARPAEGPRMPVALMRRKASELPLEFRLDDSMAMVPQSRLSAQPRVIIGARISKQSDAMPKAGDLEGYSAVVAVGTRDVQVEIAEVVK
jgi:cytochrome c-type biogenesis protein CcmH